MITTPSLELTARDVRILRAIAEGYVIDRPTLTTLFFPGDSDGSQTRRRMNMLLFHGLVHKLRPEYGLPEGCPSTTVYFPSPRGCLALSEWCGGISLRNRSPRATMMEPTKPRRRRSFLELAYSTKQPSKEHQRAASLPGIAHDLFLVGLLLVLAIPWIVSGLFT